MNDILELFKNEHIALYLIAGFIVFTIVVALLNEQLVDVFIKLTKAYKEFRNKNENEKLLEKFEEQIKQLKVLINGNKKMQEQFDTLLKNAVTKEQIEKIIYNQIQFLELKQNNNRT